MKKVVLSGVSLLALLASNNAWADYVCDSEGMRKYVSCVAGWYLDAAKAECIQCPGGLREGPEGATSATQCIANVDPGYYLQRIDKFGSVYYLESECPSGYYCPGAQGLTESTADQGKMACASVPQKTLAQIFLGGKYNPNTAFSVPTDMLSGMKSDVGAASYEQCYMEVPAGQRLAVTNSAASYESCAAGTMSGLRRTYLTNESVVANSACSTCDAGMYSADGKSCIDCDIAGKLGLGEGASIELIDKTTSGDSICAYKLNNVDIPNGVAKNIQCAMVYGTYSCHVYNDTENAGLAGYIGCDAGKVLYNYSDTGISGKVGDNRSATLTETYNGIEGLYIISSKISDLRCEDVVAGYKQSQTPSDAAGWDANIASLKGTMCESGTFCVQGSAEAEACPGKTDAEGNPVTIASQLPATGIDKCYIPSSDTTLYKDENLNTYSLKLDCYYPTSTGTEE